MEIGSVQPDIQVSHKEGYGESDKTLYDTMAD